MADLDFFSDYMEGAAPEILQRLVETNLEKTPGYGTDDYCKSAADKIRTACAAPDAEVFFLSGGTQTNKTVIMALLRAWEGVISAKTGHIAVHEAGAIENGGHKVFDLPEHLGKLDPAEVEAAFANFEADGNHDHMPAPALVYISHPTETGTLYSKAELEALSTIAHRHGAKLYLDGARLGYGLASSQTDVTLADIARTCDAFYIGGTKVGALFGEAVVFPKKGTAPHFFTFMKQQGALLAKGRILGIQFDTLFTDGLYERLGRHANELAYKVRAALTAKGYEVVFGSVTNQTFIRLTNDEWERLSKIVGLSFWEKPDAEHTVARIATSWATREEDIDRMLELL